MQRLTLFSLLLLAPLTVVQGQDYFPPPDSEGGWRTLQDAAQIRKQTGIDVNRLDQALEYAKRTSQHGGLLVVRHGWLVYEKYFGKGHREANPNMASCGKAFTSISCGIMLKEHRDQIPEGLDQKVYTKKYLPEAFPLSDPRKADIKLGHLLTHSAGTGSDRFGIVYGEHVKLEPAERLDSSLDSDQRALRASMWTKPGGGYFYCSDAHVASIVLRRLTGMELQDYINEKLAKPMQFGRWGYAMYRDGKKLAHTPGAGSIAVHSTDVLRFAYLLLNKGRWGKRQLAPADYVEMCGRPSPYNPHSPYSLQFEVNADGHVAGAPRDAFFKSGAGGYCIYVVPSLDMVIYKMASFPPRGSRGDGYDPEATGLPLTYSYDGSRDNWKPQPSDQFHDGPINGDAGTRRVLEMVVAAVME